MWWQRPCYSWEQRALMRSRPACLTWQRDRPRCIWCVQACRYRTCSGFCIQASECGEAQDCPRRPWWCWLLLWHGQTIPGSNMIECEMGDRCVGQMWYHWQCINMREKPRGEWISLALTALRSVKITTTSWNTARLWCGLVSVTLLGGRLSKRTMEMSSYLPLEGGYCGVREAEPHKLFQTRSKAWRVTRTGHCRSRRRSLHGNVDHLSDTVHIPNKILHPNLVSGATTIQSDRVIFIGDM